MIFLPSLFALGSLRFAAYVGNQLAGFEPVIDVSAVIDGSRTIALSLDSRKHILRTIFSGRRMAIVLLMLNYLLIGRLVYFRYRCFRLAATFMGALDGVL